MAGFLGPRRNCILSELLLGRSLELYNETHFNYLTT